MSTPTQHRTPRRGAFRGVGFAFLAVGVAIVLFFGYVFWGGNVAGDQAAAQILERASQQLDEQSRQTSSDASSTTPVTSAPGLSSSTPSASIPSAPPQLAEPSEAQAQSVQAPSSQSPLVPSASAQASESPYGPGDVVAVVTIPSIDLELPVLEGMGADVLDQGVLGHYPGTGAPGSVGNFAIAGHRTTHGAPLYDIDQIEVGDPIVVQTARGWDVYTMQRERIVDPGAVEVIAPVPDDPQATPTQRWMVLTSCYPKLSAAQRIVAYADFDRHVPKGEGAPAELG